MVALFAIQKHALGMMPLSSALTRFFFGRVWIQLFDASEMSCQIARQINDDAGFVASNDAFIQAKLRAKVCAAVCEVVLAGLESLSCCFVGKPQQSQTGSCHLKIVNVRSCGRRRR